MPEEDKMAAAARASDLMPEMPHACEDHGHSMLISRLYYLCIPDGTSRVDDRCGTCLEGLIQPVAEGEKESVAATLPLVESPCSSAFSAPNLAESTRLTWPEPMPRVMFSWVLTRGVGLDVLGHLPGKPQSPVLGIVRSPLGYNLPLLDIARIAVLD